MINGINDYRYNFAHESCKKTITQQEAFMSFVSVLE